MADNYLGTFVVNVADSPYADYGPVDFAMDFISRYGGIDGDHHSKWVIDQVARCLKDTAIVVHARRWGPSEDLPEGLEEFGIVTGAPSSEYLEWVERQRGEFDPESGDFEYNYDEGISP